MRLHLKIKQNRVPLSAQTYLKHEYPILVGNAAFRAWCVHRGVLGFE